MRHAAVIFGVMLVLSAATDRLGRRDRRRAAEPGLDRPCRRCTKPIAADR